MSVRPAVIDTNVIWGHSQYSPRGDKKYPEMMSSLELFYAEPTKYEIIKLCRKEAENRNEQLSDNQILIRANKRLADYQLLQISALSEDIAAIIEDRLLQSCLSSREVEDMEADISIAAIAIAELKKNHNRAICVSHNFDFFHIQRAAPEDIEVWSSLSPDKAKPKCDDVTESMLRNGVVLDALSL